jgi:hypothetical protein
MVLSFDYAVICSDIEVIQECDYIATTEVCASGIYSSPSPAQDENGTITYIGGYQNVYTILSDLNAGDIRIGTEEEEAGIEIIVGRDDNDICSGIGVITESGNVTNSCQSCTYCGNNSYSFDCSNVPYGRVVNNDHCESAIPGTVVFFPLTKEVFNEHQAVVQLPLIPLPSTSISTPTSTIQKIVRFFTGIAQRLWK